MTAFALKKLFLGLMLAASTSCLAQTPSATANNAPPEPSAAWLVRVQQLPSSAQVAALRERLQADAHRTFRNDASQTPGCYMGVSAATRERLEAARRSAPDTVVHDDRVLCVVNGRPLNGPEAATALSAVPARAIRQIRFLTGAPATAIYGMRGNAGVITVEVAK